MAFSEAKKVNKQRKMLQLAKRAAMHLYGKIILIIWNLLDANLASGHNLRSFPEMSLTRYEPFDASR
jgi:hypothetical protein